MTTSRPAASPPRQGALHRLQRWLGAGPNAALAVIWGLGPTEILLLTGTLLFFFGAKKIPEIAKGLGKGIRSFKQELEARDEEPEERIAEPQRPKELERPKD